jgi:transcriptional regulator with XRE-family HTH domain
LTTPAQQAREALGARLKDLRKDAGLTGRALADAAGWHEAKVSKIEHGRQNPTEGDLQAWCLYCNAPGQLPDLIATVRHIEAMYLEWRREMRTGQKRLQESFGPLWERTQLFRIYEPGLIPGIFQTAEYASAVISHNIERFRTPNDLEEAVAARMERQRVLYTGDRRFMIVLEEQALRTRAGNAQTMVGQLDRLLAVMSLQRVSLGIIPSMGERRTWISEGFWIYDQEKVIVETRSAMLTISPPREIAIYADVFERLQQSAVYGDKARAVIAGVLAQTTPPRSPALNDQD